MLAKDCHPLKEGTVLRFLRWPERGLPDKKITDLDGRDFCIDPGEIAWVKARPSATTYHLLHPNGRLSGWNLRGEHWEVVDAGS